MPRGLTVPEPGATLFKICPKCDVSHNKCDSSCVWFRQAMPTTPCNIISDGYELMVVEIKYHDGWRINDLSMIGDKYFLTYEDAANRILSMSSTGVSEDDESIEEADDSKPIGHEPSEEESIVAGESVPAVFIEAAKQFENMVNRGAAKSRQKQIMPPERLLKRKPRFNKPQKNSTERRISDAYERGRQAGAMYASLFEDGHKNRTVVHGDSEKVIPSNNQDWGLPRFEPYFPQNNN